MNIGPPDENDFAIRSAPIGDDLDRKVARNHLELEALRQEAEAWHTRLDRVGQRMQRYLKDVEHEVHTLVLEHLGDAEPDPEVLLNVMTMAGGIGMAREIITRVRRAAYAIETHLQIREADYQQGVMPRNIKGRIRMLRAENKNYRLSAEEAERVLTRDEQHLPAEVVQRLRQDISRYRQRADQLRSMEAQLVDPTAYRAVGESDHFRHLVLTHLAGGQ